MEAACDSGRDRLVERHARLFVLDHTGGGRTAREQDSTVAIGSIEAADSDRQRIARRFRRALAAGLEDSEAFSHVMLPAPAQLPEDAVLVTGRFLEVNDGSEALRFLVGYGIGSPALRARFEISDPAGRVLASFEEDARSFDGAGYAAHWNPAGTDELADDFAIETA